MKTYNLADAAKFLHMSQSALRTKLKAGKVRGAKPAKRWVLLESDLVDYLRSEQHVVLHDASEGLVPCLSIKEERFIGSGSRRPVASEYEEALAL